MPAPNVAALIFPNPVDAPAMAPNAAAPAGSTTPMMTPESRPEQKFFRADAQARLEQACAAPIGFLERLVAFWSNHFCVSVAKRAIGRAAAGAFERRPAMLNFLDNAQSVGPNSKAGQNRKAGLIARSSEPDSWKKVPRTQSRHGRDKPGHDTEGAFFDRSRSMRFGINENLAREILELHTMGVGSGYTQLAYILTGWTIVGREGKLGEPGTFVFNANAHEPTAATPLGRVHMHEGVAQGEAALADTLGVKPMSGLIAA
jgi:uncharacterized protein (DUF1800 family)